ncbi:MAG: hypothetical protein ACD_61C00011G0004 [uncultured bacterium]|nr:MAG: hypothetical protein ACD_61C00011G0004 [uncultured bacterium]
MELRSHILWKFVILFYAFLPLFVFVFLSLVTHSKPEPSVPEVISPSIGSPVRLIIPAIDVKADIRKLGVSPKGEMEIPDNILDVGWFKLGSLPGEKGSAVIAGHFNGENGEDGVFYNLNRLKEGDKLFVEDDKGATISFTVRESRTYDPGYAEEVYNANDSAHLNLITCDGFWDKNKKSYSKRLVVFADIEK